MVLACVIGLGNPGPEYQGTRHNVGFDWVERLAADHGGTFKHERKLFADVARIRLAGADLRLVKPQTFMNRSGQSVLAVAQFFKWSPEQLLVVHDELDLPTGTARLKQAGGHGGHNGLRDISARLGPDYLRLRLGVGHPGHKARVTGHVLNRAGRDEQTEIDSAIDRSIDVLPVLLNDGLEKAMQALHSART